MIAQDDDDDISSTPASVDSGTNLHAAAPPNLPNTFASDGNTEPQPSVADNAKSSSALPRALAADVFRAFGDTIPERAFADRVDIKGTSSKRDRSTHTDADADADFMQTS